MGLIVPLLMVEVPPLTDYPNHLARALFLAIGANDPIMSKIFAPNWQIAPNLAIDILLPPLLRIMPPLIGGKVFLGFAAVLPASGTIALNRACFERRSYWPLAVGLVVYNVPFLLGFINFQIGVGVALWGTAAWIWMARRHPVLGIFVGALFGLAAFFSHLFAFALYGLLIGCWEAGSVIQRGLRSDGIALFVVRRLGSAMVALIAPLLLYLVSPFAGTGGAVFRYGWLTKLKTLAVPVAGYSPLLTYGILAVLGLILAGLLVTRRLRIAPLAFLAFPLLTVLFFALPTGAKGVFYIDTRVPVMMGFLLFAATLPRVSRPVGVVIFLAIAALFIARMSLIGRVWVEAQQDVADVRAVLVPVTPGSRVLAVDALVDTSNGPIVPSRSLARTYPNSFWHYASFAFIDRQAFWADAFTLSGQQPVISQPYYDRSGKAGAFPMPTLQMLTGAGLAPGKPKPSHLTDWPSKFDYILVVNASAGPDLGKFLPGKLRLVARHGFAALLAVRHPAR
ncbi:hypothetical protein [Sphingomonas azotifigens]|uniref:hypothetical protein n=1 Tax=Sphingomonas azotifigens TaxID=330920 RepID=UPI00111C454D|nr:hypothetical protein [Sphingomonas azotifigens]